MQFLTKAHLKETWSIEDCLKVLQSFHVSWCFKKIPGWSQIIKESVPEFMVFWYHLDWSYKVVFGGLSLVYFAEFYKKLPYESVNVSMAEKLMGSYGPRSNRIVFSFVWQLIQSILSWPSELCNSFPFLSCWWLENTESKSWPYPTSTQYPLANILLTSSFNIPFVGIFLVTYFYFI